MNHYFTKLWVGLCLLLVNNYTNACGPMLYEDETRFSIFRKETMDDPSMDPFHYSHEKWSGYNQSAYESERAMNIEEWVAYGNKTFSKKSTAILQYQTSAEDFLTSYNTNDYSRFEGNDFMEFLLKKRNKNALEYFAFAKQVESAQRINDYWVSSWDQVQIRSRNDAMKVLAAQALEQMNKKKLPLFLKERYAFQYVKCTYYHFYYNDKLPDVNHATKVYTQHLANSASVVGQWALIYYADMQKDPLERTRYFLRAFDKSGDKRMRASQFITAADLQALQTVENDPYYLQMINILQAIRSRGRNLQNIQALYEADKLNKFLPLLMTREINKLEDWIWSNQMLRFSPSYYASEFYNKKTYGINNGNDTAYEFFAEKNLMHDIAYLQDVLMFYRSMDFGDHVIKNNFKDIAVVHLLNMNGNHKEAETMMKVMNLNQTISATLQYNYEKLIVIANNYDLNTPRTKDQIAMTIAYQEDHQPKADRLKNTSRYTYEEDVNTPDEYGMRENFDPSILVYLGRKYIAAGYPEIGALMLHKSKLATNEYAYSSYKNSEGNYDTMNYAGISFLEKYIAAEDVDKVLALKHKLSKSKFEQIIAPDIWSADLMYQDLKGTLYFRKGDYKRALEVFDKMPEDFWFKNYEFMQYLPTQSITNVGTYMPKGGMHNGKQYSIQSKKLITQDMIQLQQDIIAAKGAKEKARAQLYYANALFNVSYYGSAWMAYAYGKSSTEVGKRAYYQGEYAWAYYFLPESPSNNTQNYYGLQHALAAYKAVWDTDPKSEVAAAAMLMAALCDQLGSYYETSKRDPYVLKKEDDDFQSPYFQMLKQQYSNTEVYQLAKTHCIDVK